MLLSSKSLLSYTVTPRFSNVSLLEQFSSGSSCSQEENVSVEEQNFGFDNPLMLIPQHHKKRLSGNKGEDAVVAGGIEEEHNFKTKRSHQECQGGQGCESAHKTTTAGHGRGRKTIVDLGKQKQLVGDTWKNSFKASRGG